MPKRYQQSEPERRTARGALNSLASAAVLRKANPPHFSRSTTPSFGHGRSNERFQVPKKRRAVSFGVARTVNRHRWDR